MKNIARNPAVMATIQGDELILLNPLNGQYFGANKTGAEIWNLLDECPSTQQLVEELAIRYSGDRDSITKAVEQFLSSLKERALIV